MTTKAFAGIDVAFAKNKRLPVVVCVREGEQLIPRPLREFREALPPRGRGNRLALDTQVVHDFALEAVEYLRAVEKAYDLEIERIAIDAPSSYKGDGVARRAAELAMDKLRISCFATPSETEFAAIRTKANGHLDSGGAESCLPHANQLWMLVGFALFEMLSARYECIEVFPNAIVDALQARTVHKSKSEGLATQLSAVAKYSGWPPANDHSQLDRIAFGSRHDKLDAYLSAWVASLPSSQRLASGAEPSDVIWIPNLNEKR